MKTHHLFAFLILFALIVSCSGKEKKAAAPTSPKNSLPVDTALQSRLKAFAAKPRVQGRFGLYVYDLTAGREVFAEDADHSQPIASSMKLLSGVAALHRLGADYLYRTTIYTRGPIVGDTLRGDIALKAGLDPQLQAQDLAMFARALRRAGIRHVTGHCYLDLTLREKVKAEQHWYPWDLSFSRYGILYKGPDAIIRAMRAALNAQGIRQCRSNTSTPLPGPPPRGGSAPTPAPSPLGRGSVTPFFIVAKITGPYYTGEHDKGLTSLSLWHGRFRFYRSIGRVTQRMWKNSSNTNATALLYTLGNAVNPRNDGSADQLAAAGVAYMRAFLRDNLNMTDTALVVHDGCGLCTYNHLSPRALCAILAYGYAEKPIYHRLMQGLAISGVDGTLRRLLSDYRLRGKIHGKTGTLSHPYGISSLAGYCRGADGHDLCFALLDSKMSVLDAHVLQRKLAMALVGQK